MNCFVTVKGVPYTKEEFVKLVSEEGLSALVGESPSELAQILLTRFDTKRPDSVYEMMAKLELKRQQLKGKYEGVSVITEDLAKELIYPRGATNSYQTQGQIHKNTYSGVKLTGIAANFMKALIYVLEMGNPIAIKGPDGTIYRDGTPELSQLLLENDAKSINDLVWKNNNYRIEEREKVGIKPTFKFNNYTFDSFSLNEIENGKPIEIYKDGEESVYYNIFETLDTIVNLAIDNVKEQKLFVLGITNANANAFLSAISLGIPLNKVSLIFQSPTVSMLSQGRSLNIDAELENLKERIVSNFAGEDILQSVRRVNPSLPLTGKVTLMQALTKDGSIIEEILEKQYTGELKADSLDSQIHDYIVLANLKKLTDIGNEFFTYSRIFKALRQLPNNYTDVDVAITDIESVTKSKTEKNKKTILRREYLAAVERAIMESEEYLKLDELERPAFLNIKMEAVKVSPVAMSEFENVYRQDYINRVLNKMISREFEPTNESMLRNGSPLNIPHVFSVYNTLIKLRRAMESSFAVHSPLISQFAESVLESVNLKGPKNEKMEIVKSEFIKFISSALTLNIKGQSIDIDVPDDLEYGQLRGKEAWAASFVDTISEEQKTNPNMFIQSLEIRTNREGHRSVGLTADKSSNPEDLEYVRESFVELLNEKPELAVNFFKYAIIDQGLFFSRTSLSLVFPATFAAEFSSKLDDVLSNILPKDSKGVRTGLSRANLETIREAFLYQFLRNNPDMVQYSSALGDPIIKGQYYNFKGEKVDLYAGRNGSVQFDLEYNGDAQKSPRILNRYGKVYVKIKAYDVPGKVYYRRLASKTYTTAYKFTTDNLYSSFSFDQFTNPQVMFEDMSFANSRGNWMFIPTVEAKYAVGEVVHLFDYASPNPNSAVIVRITGVSPESKGYRYKYAVEGKADFNKVNQYEGELSAIAAVRSSAFRTVKAQSMKDALKVKRVSRARSILIADEGGDINFQLGRYVTDNPSDVTRDIIEMINRMEIKNETIIVPTDVLSRISSSHPAEAYRVAQALYEKTGVDLAIFGVTIDAGYDNAANIFNIVTKLTNTSADISKASLSFSASTGFYTFNFNKPLVVGDIYHHSDNIFLYIEGVAENGSYLATPVPVAFMETLDGYSFTTQDFYALYNKFKNDKCAQT